MKLIVTFKTPTAATRAHWEVSEAGIECKLIPVPERLGVKCGYSLCADICEKGKICEVLKNKGIRAEDFFEMNE